MKLPCKIVLNQGVIAVATATNQQLLCNESAFTPEAIDSMIDLDLAYLTAKHLIQNDDEKTMALVAIFGMNVAGRAAAAAAKRAEELGE